jgi:hypothetical protein
LRYQADPGGVAVEADWTREDPPDDPAELLEESEEAGDIESAAQG